MSFLGVVKLTPIIKGLQAQLEIPHKIAIDTIQANCTLPIYIEKYIWPLPKSSLGII
jgi:hypothetical protein